MQEYFKDISKVVCTDLKCSNDNIFDDDEEPGPLIKERY